MEHLDSLLKLKEERIEELQKQLDRKQTRRKEVEAFQNSLVMPIDTTVVQLPPTPTANLLDDITTYVTPLVKSNFVKMTESSSKLPKPEDVNGKTTKLQEPYPKELKLEEIKVKPTKSEEFNYKVLKLEELNTKVLKFEESKIPIPIVDLVRSISKPSITEVNAIEDPRKSVEKVKIDVFKKVEIVEQKSECLFNEIEEFKDSEQETVVTIEDTIENESKDINNPIQFMHDFSYVN